VTQRPLLKWVYRELGKKVAFIEESGFTVPVRQLLHSRGFGSREEMDDFLDPRLKQLTDPFLLPGMTAAVEEIHSAIVQKKKMVVFGDYDVDGVTSTALLVQVLSRLGGQVHPFLPHRMEEGYGLNLEALKRCWEEYQPQVVIAVDCGTSSVSEVAWINELGARVIIIDHHEPAQSLPAAVALVNPKVANTGADATYFCTVGLCFKLVHALLKKLISAGTSQSALPDLRSFLDLVALGTVADLVPLIKENRIFVKAGLKTLEQSENLGLRHLIRVSAIKPPFSSDDVGFRIGPRLNASGRLESAMESLELLLADDNEKAAFLAQSLNDHNSSRQAIEKRIYQEALDALSTQYDPDRDFVIVLSRPDWHIGVVGIVASRIMRVTARPAIVIGFDKDGQGKGSCRSIDGFNIVTALETCSVHLVKFGGHPMAAGISITAGAIDDFRRGINVCARALLNQDDLVHRLKVDVQLSLDEVTPALLEELTRLEPFGKSNPSPVFYCKNVALARTPNIVGKNHLKFSFSRGSGSIDGICFNWGQSPVPHGFVDIAFVPQWEEFNGRRSIQLLILDVRETTGH